MIKEKVMIDVKMTLKENGLCFVDAVANLGVRDLGLRINVDGKDVVARYGTATEADGVVTASLWQ